MKRVTVEGTGVACIKRGLEVPPSPPRCRGGGPRGTPPSLQSHKALLRRGGGPRGALPSSGGKGSPLPVRGALLRDPPLSQPLPGRLNGDAKERSAGVDPPHRWIKFEGSPDAEEPEPPLSPLPGCNPRGSWALWRAEVDEGWLRGGGGRWGGPLPPLLLLFLLKATRAKDTEESMLPPPGVPNPSRPNPDPV
jgi:hypothetical protein